MDDKSKRQVLLIPYCDTPVALDGSLQEACWGGGDNATGALRWMASKEIAMRAYAGSEEEFRKMPAPSYTNASFAYGRDGLYIGFRVNHVSPENSPSKFSDDDGEMWKDNCMEFFFKPNFAKEGGQIYHLIVNTNGNKVMMQGARALDSSGIKTAVKGNVDSSGGSSQELLIPWKVFGLACAPAPGTVWLANVGREYHPLRQYTSWGKVYGNFWEVEKWGALNFAGTKDEVDIKPKEVCLFPGKNRMEGRALFRNGAAGRLSPLALNLKDAAGKVVGSTPLDVKPGVKELAFSLDYTIPCLREPEEWTLSLDDSTGKSLGSLKLPLPAGRSTILVNHLPDPIRSGERFCVDALFRVGNVDVVGIALNGEFVTPDGKTRAPVGRIVLNAGGEGKIWVDSSGLAPGKWLFRMWLERRGAKEEPFEKEIEVLPPF